LEQQDAERYFKSQITSHGTLVFKVCRMYAYTPADREDLYQEIILQAWKAFPRFRGDAQFSTWLYRIGINTAITGLQKKSRRIRTSPIDHADDVHTNEAFTTTENDQWHELQLAIEQLNDVEKALVMLYLEDLSYDEMEKILGISEATLRVKMNRIKQKLKKITNS
jgi:RNA polymerase sigma-70 factor (ECF subfamily)